MEIRTPRGKLVGVFNETTGLFCVKDRNKELLIEIPSSGLRLTFMLGDGKVEEVYIPPRMDKPITI